MLKLTGPFIFRFLIRAWLFMAVFGLSPFFVVPKEAEGKGILSKLKKVLRRGLKKKKQRPSRLVFYIWETP